MDTPKKYITKSFQETQKLGQNFASEILAAKKKTLRRGSGQTAVVLALQGDLGAGKTTFLQGFARGLGIKENILSPTFVILKRFKLKGGTFKNFYHIDLYRIEGEQSIKELGFKEILSNPKNIVAIEWPEKISKILNVPSLRAKRGNLVSITFKHLEINKRELTFDI